MQPDGTFRRKSIQAIRDDLRNDVEQILGTDVDLSPGSPHGQMLDLATLELASAWESMQAVHNAVSFEGAYGIQLDRLLALVGIGRLERRPATGEVMFSRNTALDEAAPIPSGTVVTTPPTESQPAVPFKTTEPVEIPPNATSVTGVPIRGLYAHETSPGQGDDVLGVETNVSADTITIIADPLSGVDNVTNLLPTGTSGTRDDGSEYTFRHGRDRETDEQFKRRYSDSLAISGKATLAALRANVRNADETVRSASIEENVTMTDETDAGGLPRKSFRITVRGGVDDNIAQEILNTRSAGIESYGTASGTATDGGQTYTEFFERAAEVPIYVDVTVKHDGTFPADGETQIKENIIAYIGGELSSGDFTSGTEIGEDVIHYLVETAAGLPSVWDATAYIGTSTNPTGEADISIAPDEFAETSHGNITVTTSEENIP